DQAAGRRAVGRDRDPHGGEAAARGGLLLHVAGRVEPPLGALLVGGLRRRLGEAPPRRRDPVGREEAEQRDVRLGPLVVRREVVELRRLLQVRLGRDEERRQQVPGGGIRRRELQ